MKKVKLNLAIFLIVLFILVSSNLSMATNSFTIKGYIDSFKTNEEVNGELEISRMGYE